MNGRGNEKIVSSACEEMPFAAFDFRHGLLSDMLKGPFPTTVRAWAGGLLELSGGRTHFGFVDGSLASLACDAGRFQLKPGMYFAVPGRAEVGGEGPGLVITSHHHHGFFHLGGPVESTGRLRYIDGCTDSLLIPPLVLGHPCLNLLCIPPPRIRPAIRSPRFGPASSHATRAVV